MEGTLKLTVSETAGKVNAGGSLILEQDETSFMLNRLMAWRDDSAAALGAVGYTEIKVNAFDLSKMTIMTSRRIPARFSRRWMHGR